MKITSPCSCHANQSSSIPSISPMSILCTRCHEKEKTISIHHSVYIHFFFDNIIEYILLYIESPKLIEWWMNIEYSKRSCKKNKWDEIMGNLHLIISLLKWKIDTILLAFVHMFKREKTKLSDIMQNINVLHHQSTIHIDK